MTISWVGPSQACGGGGIAHPGPGQIRVDPGRIRMEPGEIQAGPHSSTAVAGRPPDRRSSSKKEAKNRHRPPAMSSLRNTPPGEQHCQRQKHIKEELNGRKKVIIKRTKN